jgi:hypothetical protein
MQTCGGTAGTAALFPCACLLIFPAFVNLSSLAQIAVQMMTPGIVVYIQWTDACLHHAPSGFANLTVRIRAGVACLSRCGPKSHLSR